MQKENRLIINSQCDYEPLQEWQTWVHNRLIQPDLLRKIIKYRPGASTAFSYVRFALIIYNNKKIKVDLIDGSISSGWKKSKFQEGEFIKNEFKIKGFHQTSDTLIHNRRIDITVPDLGIITLNTNNRGVNINLDDDVQKSLTPANSRGALVSELCAKEISKLSTSLPLQKGQDEIDYANKILEDRWLKHLNEFEKWKAQNPEQHTNDKWTQLGDGKGGKRKIPTEKPEKVKW